MLVTNNTQSCRFTPIKLTITLESKDELLELYHRLNICQSDVQRSAKLSNVPCFARDNLSELWNVLSEECKKL